MKDNWSDQRFASDWDNNAAVNNPMRNLLLSLLLTLVEDNYAIGDKILDLGFGSGQIEKMIFKKLPDAEITGVDSSETMIKLAKKKIGIGSKLSTIHHDLNNTTELELPNSPYKFVITSFVLHEISATHKKEIFKYAFDALTDKGIYILVDRFRINIKDLRNTYKAQWHWQSQNANITNWSDWKEQFEEYEKRMVAKDDSPDPVDDQLMWLREIGFTAACVQLQFDRGLIVGVKNNVQR